jgi:hypothetical protein
MEPKKHLERFLDNFGKGRVSASVTKSREPDSSVNSKVNSVGGGEAPPRQLSFSVLRLDSRIKLL